LNYIRIERSAKNINRVGNVESGAKISREVSNYMGFASTVVFVHVQTAPPVTHPLFKEKGRCSVKSLTL